MRKLTKHACAATLAAALACIAGTVHATGQSTRTFVSGNGTDSNPCTLAAPCRSFAEALMQTAPGGEITVLESAGYGSLTINQSVTITNPGGVEAGVTAASGATAITVAAGSSGIVTLRGLTIEGGGVGSRGIDATSFGTLNIIDCVVKDFTNSPIVIEPNQSGPAQLTIADTYGLNGGSNGLALLPVGAVSLSFAVNGSTFNSNGGSGMAIDASGVTSSDHTIGSIVGSHFNLNAVNGIAINNGTDIEFSVKNSTGNNNGFAGVYYGGTGTNEEFVASSEFSFEQYGLYAVSGTPIDTYGDNDLSDDGTPNHGAALVSLQ